MKEIIKAIKRRFDDEGVFKAALTGGLFLGSAPFEVDSTEPYCAVVPGVEPFWTFENNLATYTIRMWLVSSARSAKEIMDLEEKMKDCFDEAPLVIEGAHLLRFWRVSSTLERVDNRWELAVEYNCQIQEE